MFSTVSSTGGVTQQTCLRTRARTQRYTRSSNSESERSKVDRNQLGLLWSRAARGSLLNLSRWGLRDLLSGCSPDLLSSVLATPLSHRETLTSPRPVLLRAGSPGTCQNAGSQAFQGQLGRAWGWAQWPVPPAITLKVNRTNALRRWIQGLIPLGSDSEPR